MGDIMKLTKFCGNFTKNWFFDSLFDPATYRTSKEQKNGQYEGRTRDLGVAGLLVFLGKKS